MLLSATSVALAYVNWLGLTVVGNIATVLGFISMTPFVLIAIYGIWKIEPSRWLERPSGEDLVHDDDGIGPLSAITWGGIIWRPFLNNLFWKLNSFDSVGCFSGDVEPPVGKTLPRAMFLALIMLVIGYLVPLLTILGATDSTQADWVDGFLSKAASEIGGPWLGAWIVVAAGINNVGMFQAELSGDALQLLGMAERGFVPKIFATRSKHGTPTYGILLGTCIIVLLAVSRLDKLIELLNFNYAISLMMEYAAFIKLRISKPEGEFRISFGVLIIMAD